MHYSESGYLSDADLQTVELPDLSNQNVLILSTPVGTSPNYFAELAKNGGTAPNITKKGEQSTTDFTKTTKPRIRTRNQNRLKKR